MFFLFFLASMAMAIESKEISWKGARYRHALIDLQKWSIEIASASKGSFSMKEAMMRKNQQGYTPMLAMNAGMFHPDYSAVGLLIEEGHRKQELSLAEGRGNFFLKPNGVFFIDASGNAQIVESSVLKDDTDIRWATQSGPLLLSDGDYHPSIRAESKNRRIRNGLCIDASQNVHFILSVETVNFYHLASLMKEELNCSDGLYLDGVISEWAEKGDESYSSAALGPILVVYPLEK